MESKRITDAKSESQLRWENAETQGDWQLAETDAEDTAELLTTPEFEADDEHLHASADDPDDERDSDDDQTDEEPHDWGRTDPLDSPLPDSNDPSGPGSAV